MVCPNIVTVLRYGAIYDVSYRLTTIVLGLCIRDSYIHVKGHNLNPFETTPYELWFGQKPKLSFLKVWGCDAYKKKFHPDKLKPKSKKCVFIGYPKETVGYTFYHRSEGKIFVAKNGSFLEKEFLLKEVSGRKVELNEVTVPAPLLESSSSQKPVPPTPTPISEEANDLDHETSDQVTTEPRRSTRVRSAPEWYSNPVLEVMLLDHDEPTNYESDDEPRFREMA